jgi:hypothetical protein
VAVAAAAAVVLAVLVVRRPAAPGQRLDRDYVAALRTLGGSSLRAARLHAPDGTDAGEVFLYEGHPSWVFVDVHHPAALSGPYRTELISARAPALVVEGLSIDGGMGSVGRSLLAEVEDVTGVAIVGPNGAVRYTAQLSPHHHS